MTKTWKSDAQTAVLVVAAMKMKFTTDDVWATGLKKSDEPRALGAVMLGLAKTGAIEKTGEYVTTTQVSRHGAPVAVWRART